MPVAASLQRGLLFALIACVALCGLAGVYALIGGTMSDTQSRVLGTTVACGLACLLGWASAMPLARNRWRILPIAALIFIVAALGACLAEIWDLLDDWGFQTREKVPLSTTILAVILTQISLLGLARLRKSYEWIRLATAAASGVLVLLAVLHIWSDIHERDAWRVYGVLIILVVCGSMSVMILHRISAIRTTDALTTTPGMLSLICPRCNQNQQLPAGKSRCGQCGLGFNIEILEDQCRKCGYPLYQLESAICPECGTPFARDTQPSDPIESPL